MAPPETIFLTASSVTFRDDAAFSSSVRQEANLEPQEVFYISRLNDPTTYFFNWLCKRYGLTLHEEPIDCPICFDRVTNSIQLSCGHIFCRQCLKAAAECEMSSCALCRKSHTLDPDMLRKQWEQQRVANLTWRLGKTKATMSFSKPQWEAGQRQQQQTKSCPPYEDLKASVVKVVKRGEAGGKDTTHSLATTPTQPPPFSTPAVPHEPASPVPDELLTQRARKLRMFDTDGDVGGLSGADLYGRWASIMQVHGATCSGESPCGDGVSDVGSTSCADLLERWGSLSSGASLGSASQEDVGAATEDELKLRGTRCAVLARIGRDVGGWKQQRLTEGWASLMAVACLPPDAGAATVDDLSSRWASLKQIACIGKGTDAGGALSERWCGMLAEGMVGSTPHLGATGSTVLAHAWAELKQASSELPPPVGSVLAGSRWSEMETFGVDHDMGDVGGCVLRELQGRWTNLQCAGAGTDCGADTTAVLAAKWQSCWRQR